MFTTNKIIKWFYIHCKQREGIPMSAPNVNLKTFSEQWQLNSFNQNATNIRNTAPNAVDNKAQNGDTFTIAGKKISKKKVALSAAIIASAAAIGLAIIKRKDIGEFLQTMKFKHAKPEAIVIPGKGYDLSKEAGQAAFDMNRSLDGFAGVKMVDNSGKIYTTNTVKDAPEDMKRLCTVARGTGSLGIGITKDGHAFVSVDGRSQVVHHPQYHEMADKHRLAYITLISDSKEFTPAQKNLIALIQQNKQGSVNSPFGELAGEVIGENPTTASILDAVAKWAKDIDTADVETQKVLGRLSKLKKGQTTTAKLLTQCESPISYNKI